MYNLSLKFWLENVSQHLVAETITIFFFSANSAKDKVSLLLLLWLEVHLVLRWCLAYLLATSTTL